MTIVDDLTPVYYEILNILLSREEDGIIATFATHIRNGSGDILTAFYPRITLTEGEKSAVIAFINRETTAFEEATGLERWTEQDD